MTLLRSFAHNVVIHPLLFVRDVAERVGLHRVAIALAGLHDDHELESMKLEFHPDAPAPPQQPWTPEAERLVYRPAMRPPAAEPPAPLRGSLAERRRARVN